MAIKYETPPTEDFFLKYFVNSSPENYFLKSYYANIHILFILCEGRAPHLAEQDVLVAMIFFSLP